MGLGREMIDFVEGRSADQGGYPDGIRDFKRVEPEAAGAKGEIGVGDGVLGRSGGSVNVVPLGEEELREVGTVLSGDASDECDGHSYLQIGRAIRSTDWERDDLSADGAGPQIGRETIYPQMAQMAQMGTTADCGDRTDSGKKRSTDWGQGDLSADGADDADDAGLPIAGAERIHRFHRLHRFSGPEREDLSADGADSKASTDYTDYTDSEEGQNLGGSPTDSLRGIAQKGPESHASFGPICVICAICG